MEHAKVVRLLDQYKSQHGSGGRALIIACIAALIIVEALIIFAINANAADRATIGAALVAIDTVLFAGWQWWEQRRQATLEAYFTRLDIPNQRRLSFYEQLAAQGAKVDTAELKRFLKQFYVFYVYAELDNLEYAMRKYADHSIAAELAERAVYTFVSRCTQSQNFCQTVCGAIRQSGYPKNFETLVLQLATCPEPASGPEAHPMQYNELEVIDGLK